MTRSTSYATCSLVPMNLHSSDEFEAMRQQRLICGWNYVPEKIAAWRDMMDRGLRSLFWIQLSDGRRVGHISLDSEDPSDPELAKADRSVMTIATFFILPEHRSGGIGRAAMDVIEELATKSPYGSPHCKALTVNALSRRYTEGEGEEWRGLWPRLGMSTPKHGTSNEDWYKRRGYEKWKEEGKYKEQTKDGENILLVASFMKKHL